MGLYKELCSKDVESPDLQIAVVDTKYILKNNLEVCIEKVEVTPSSYYFVVESEKGDIFFKTRDKFFGRELLTVYDEPLLNICACTSNRVKRRIYRGDTEEELLGEIRKKDTLRGKKFTIDFNRIDSGRKVSLTMVCDKDLRICDLIYSNDNGHKMTVGKVVRSLFNRVIYEVEIASGMDTVFVLGLFIFFVEITHQTARKGYIGSLK